MSKLRMMRYTLNSGIKETAMLSQEDIERWRECFNKQLPFEYVHGKSIYGIAPSLVANWKIEDGLTERYTHIEPFKQMEPNNSLGKYEEKSELLAAAYNSNLKSQKLNTSKIVVDLSEISKLEVDRSEYPHLYRIECRCKDEYYVYSKYPIKKSACRNCNKILITDYDLGEFMDKFGAGLLKLSTNKYYVANLSLSEYSK